MRGAAGDEEVDGNLGGAAVVLLGVIDVRAAGDGAGADGDHNARVGDGVVSVLQGGSHVFGDAASDEQTVGVARGGDELDAEAAQIPANGVENVHIRFAAVASAGADLTEFERSAKEP